MTKPENIYALQDTQEQRIEDQTKDRAVKNRSKKMKRGDYAITSAALHTIAEIRESVEEALQSFIDYEMTVRPGNQSDWFPHVKYVPVENTAELALRVCLDAVHAGWSRTNTLDHLAKALEASVLNIVLLSTKAGKTLLKNVASNNKDKGGSSYTMRQRAIYIASKEKKRLARDNSGNLKLNEDGTNIFEKDPTAYQWKPWDLHLSMKVGGIMLAAVQKGAPGIFVFVEAKKKDTDKHNSLWITLTDEASERLASQEEWIDGLTPIHSPMFSEPKDWGVNSTGPYNSNRLSMLTPVVKNMPSHQLDAIEEGMLNGELNEALEALNTVQKVPYSLNQTVLEAVKWTFDKVLQSEGKLKVTKFPSVNELKLDKNLHSASDKRDIEKHNREVTANLLAMKRRLKEADNLLSQSEMTDRFFLPHNWDFRGRVYHTPEFGHHNTDYMRAMFLFANGEQVNEANVHHLHHQLANTFGQGEDKKPFTERQQWALDNMDKILAVGADYKNEDTFAFWSTADEPFQFLAACCEMYNYQQHGEGYISGLPIAKDATQSGIQFYAALGRNREDGEKVNLTESETPGDLYNNVLEASQKIIADDIEELTAASLIGNGLDEEDQKKLECAKQWTAHGLKRGHLKSPTMTWSYSSDLFGFADKIRDTEMKELTRDLRHGNIEEHPFGDDKGYAASWYFAKVAKQAIEDTVKSAADGMRFIREMADLCSATNLHLQFKTPLNFPMMQFYREKDKNKKPTFPEWEAEAAELKSGRATVQVYSDEIRTLRSANSSSPNFIHSLDATLLMKSVLVCKERGVVNMMTVHDSFSTTIGSVDVMVDSIRDSFVELFSDYCPYHALFHQTMQRVGDKFELPAQRDLDLTEVRKSPYFVS